MVGIPLLGHPHDAFPCTVICLLCCHSFLEMNLWIGLCPAVDIGGVGYFVVFAFVKRWNDIKTHDLATSVLIGVCGDAKFNHHGTALASDLVTSVLLNQCCFKRGKQIRSRFFATLLFLFTQHAKDVHIL